MNTPREPTVTTRILRPRTTVPGLAIEDLRLAPDATVVAALTGADSSGTSTLLFLDTRTGAERGTVTVPPEELAVLATGWSVGASHNWRTGEIRLWRPVTGEPLGRLNPHRDRGVHALAVADDGTLAASIGEDFQVALWGPREVELITSFSPRGAVDLETATLTFSPDGRLLGVRTDADTVELWSTDPVQFRALLRETGDPVFSPDGRWAATAGNAIAIYDLRTTAAPVTLTGRGPLSFTPDGELLVAAAADGSTAVWRTDPARPFAHMRGGTPRELSPDGQVMAISGPGTAVTLVDLLASRTIARLTGHRGEVQALAIGPGGSVTVAACSDATLRVWESDTP